MTLKRIIVSLLFFLLLIFANILISGTIVIDFHARRANNTVEIEWATVEEANLDKFILYRSTNRENWNKLNPEIKSKSGNSSTGQTYKYIDKTIFKASLSNFYYRLEIIDKNGQSTDHGVIISISGSSGIKHTWGSIKAIFR